MNIYVLVEGRKTEALLYPAWICGSLPGHVQIEDFTAPQGNSVFCFSSGGYPYVIDRDIPNAVTDLRVIGAYDAFLIVVDCDDRSPADLEAEIHARVEAAGGLPPRTILTPIIQRRCVETWLLGNRAFIPRFPNRTELVECKRFFDVTRTCPEGMASPSDYTGTNSSYHNYYLKQAFRERRQVYSKRNPGFAADVQYFQALVARNAEGDLPTMQPLIEFLGLIGQP